MILSLLHNQSPRPRPFILGLSRPALKRISFSAYGLGRFLTGIGWARGVDSYFYNNYYFCSLITVA